MTRGLRLLLLGLVAGAGACGGGRDAGRSARPAEGAAGAGAPAQAPAPALAGEGAPDGVRVPFSRPVVVFLQATSEEIEAARAGMADQDFYAMTDDLAFYRASAYEYLQKRKLPVVHVDGRRPLLFVVNDTARTYDFAEERTLDLLVAYDGRRAPRAFAPIDVQRVDEVLAPADSAGGDPGSASRPLREPPS